MPDPAIGREGGLPPPSPLDLVVERVEPRRQRGIGEVRCQPVANLAGEGRFVVGVGQVHRRNGSGRPLTSPQMSSYVTTDGREVRTRGQKTRARLLQAGAQVFGTKGFHTARVDDIVRAAKTSHGTFYVYFPSKEALARRVADPDRPRDGRAGRGSPRPAGQRRRGARCAPRAGCSDSATSTTGPARSCSRGPRSSRASDSDHDTPGALNAGSDLLAALADALGPKLVVPSSGAGQPTSIRASPRSALMALIERFHYYAATGQLRAEGDEVLDTLTDVVASTLVR